MIEIKLESYEEKDIINLIVQRVSRDILSQKKFWGEVPEEGHYSDFDKFKNQIAKLVSEKLYEDMINSGEVAKHVATALEKAEKTIDNRLNKKVSDVV